MGCLGNVIWFLCGGLWQGLAWTISGIFGCINGILLCCTIIGIPFGMQCFKIAKLALMPFGATVNEV